MRKCNNCKQTKPLSEFIRGYDENKEPIYRKETCTDCSNKLKQYWLEHYVGKKKNPDIIRTKLLAASEKDLKRREKLKLTCQQCSKYPCYKGQENSKWNFATTCINIDEPKWNQIKDKITNEVYNKKNIHNEGK